MTVASAATTVAAVIGDPITHSLSPRIHNAAFAATGLDWVFVALPVPAGKADAALDGVRHLGLAGLSVTMPHKDAVAVAADERSPAVDALGAANCVVAVGDGRVRAENTDGVGFVAGLQDDAGVSPNDRRVAVLGAGGAARAVVDAVARAGATEVIVVNRSATRAEAAAALAPIARVGTIDDVRDADIVVNATPIGMLADSAMPCDPGLITRDQVVVDLVYGPQPTTWVRALRRTGHEAHDGTSMLVHQAAAAFTLWTGVEAPIDAMREAVTAGV